MKFEITITDEECREVIAKHISEKLGIIVPPKELSACNYGGGYTLGKYGGYEYPPKPEKPAKPVPVDVPAAVADSPPVSTAEVLAGEKPPF